MFNKLYIMIWLVSRVLLADVDTVLTMAVARSCWDMACLSCSVG